MTAVMAATNAMLPPEERLPLPQEPLQITTELLKRSGLEHAVSARQLRRLSWLAHFGYGAAAGAVYGWMRGHREAASPPSGAAYGLVVWALGYCGWLPAVGILAAPHRRGAGRNAVLIASHLVWGTALLGRNGLLDRNA